MAKKILIDAHLAGETRVAVVDGTALVDFDSEIESKRPIKGNVYLARVVRVEPSLQAVFIEYGDERNGFLPFTEIHPDYYRIPIADREELLEAESAAEEDEEENRLDLAADDMYAYPDAVVESLMPSNKTQRAAPKKNRQHYNVQEVIQHKQILLVQAIKDPRGSKGAAFTTYLSLPGQYCVLMPNAGNRLGGISKRIQEDSTRQRLKDVLKGLKIPDKMSVIIRTAGQERTKAEIRRDYEYLVRVWDDIRQKTLESIAPSLIREEGDLLIRAIRDFYTKDITEIIVNDPDAYTQTKTFLKQLSPSGAKKVKLYKDSKISLFNAYDVESQILSLISPRVELPSGGSIVIGQTEALVAIDVNSGKATRERNIDSTALKTNLEAAKEIAKQLRLRDLSGLVVIDFIDMNEQKALQQVTHCFKEAIAADHARIQVGEISQFCLLELSRQRLRTGLMETYSETCPHCQGRGRMYSAKYFLATILHLLEKNAADNADQVITITVPIFIYNALLNGKRKELSALEEQTGCTIQVNTESKLSDNDFFIACGAGSPTLFSLGKTAEDSEDAPHSNWIRNPAESETPDVLRKEEKTTRQRRRQGDRAEKTKATTEEAAPETAQPIEEAKMPSTTEETTPTAKRRRRRRQGDRAEKTKAITEEAAPETAPPIEEAKMPSTTEETTPTTKRRRRRRREGRAIAPTDAEVAAPTYPEEAIQKQNKSASEADDSNLDIFPDIPQTPGTADASQGNRRPARRRHRRPSGERAAEQSSPASSIPAEKRSVPDEAPQREGAAPQTSPSPRRRNRGHRRPRSNTSEQSRESPLSAPSAQTEPEPPARSQPNTIEKPKQKKGWLKKIFTPENES